MNMKVTDINEMKKALVVMEVNDGSGGSDGGG